MTAIATERDTTRDCGNCPTHAGVKADEIIYQGTIAGIADGLIVADPTTENYLTVGRAMRTRNATGLLDGDLTADIEEGTFEFAGSGIGSDDVGKVVFVVDNQTVSLDSSSGTRPFAGIVRRQHATEGLKIEMSLSLSTMYAQGGNAALASVGVGEGASLVGIEDSAGLYTATTVEAALAEVSARGIHKRTVQITHAELTDAVNGEAQVLNIGAVLPANAVVLGHDVLNTTVFSGGGATAVTLDIGGTDPDAIVDGMDVFTGAATGALSPRTGVHAQGKFSAQQLTATFTPDGAHTLLDLTAGDLTITVWYSVLA